jgi:hypothetical protein
MLTPPPTPPHIAPGLPAYAAPRGLPPRTLTTESNSSSGSSASTSGSTHIHLGLNRLPSEAKKAKAFNVRHASQVCKQKDGYVSFGEVEGLGTPPGEDEDDEEEKTKKWNVFLRLFGLRSGGERGSVPAIERSGTY